MRKFSAFHGGRSPEELGADDVGAFMVHLMRERGLHWRTRNQYAGALKFLYGVVLRRPEVRAVIGNTHGPKPLPTVLSHQEVWRLLEAFDSPVHRTIALLCYGAGLRVSEACELRAEQVDSERRVLRIEHSKRGKSREVTLSPRLLERRQTDIGGPRRAQRHDACEPLKGARFANGCTARLRSPLKPVFGEE